MNKKDYTLLEEAYNAVSKESQYEKIESMIMDTRDSQLLALYEVYLNIGGNWSEYNDQVFVEFDNGYTVEASPEGDRIRVTIDGELYYECPIDTSDVPFQNLENGESLEILDQEGFSEIERISNISNEPREPDEDDIARSKGYLDADDYISQNRR